MTVNHLGLEKLGITQTDGIRRNPPVEKLIEDMILNKEGTIGMNGAAMVDTGLFTGRSPLDKYIVEEATSSENIWWGDVNRMISSEIFDDCIKK